jgi:hypothetical protein
VAKCPEIGPTTSVRGWSPTEGSSKCIRVANGVDRTGRTVTPASSPPTTTESMTQSGRMRVGREAATIWQAALIRRETGSPATGAGNVSRVRSSNCELTRAGAVSRRCHSYAV